MPDVSLTSRRVVLPLTLLVAVAVGVAGIVWLNLRRGQPAGTQLEEDAGLYTLDDADALPDRTVLLPVGQLTITVSKPLRELPSGAGERGTPDRVGGFGRWVAVGWQLRPSSRLRDGRSVAAQGENPQFSVVAVADGVRYDLAAGSTEDDDSDPGDLVRDKGVYLALPAEPGGFTVEVGFAGVVQVLDPRTGELRTGAAAPLYAAAPSWSTRAPACVGQRAEVAVPGFGAAPNEDLSVRCEIRSGFAVPYVTGIGWARPGRTWLVLPVTTRASSGLYVNWPSFEATPNALYVLRLRSSSLFLGGATPTTTLPYYQQSAQELLADGVTGAYYVFDVAPGEPARAVLRQLYADDAPGADAPPNAPRQARGTLTIAIDLTPPT